MKKIDQKLEELIGGLRDVRKNFSSDKEYLARLPDWIAFVEDGLKRIRVDLASLSVPRQEIQQERCAECKRFDKTITPNAGDLTTTKLEPATRDSEGLEDE